LCNNVKCNTAIGESCRFNEQTCTTSCGKRTI